MPAGANLLDCAHGLTVIVNSDPFGERMDDPQLIRIHDKFFVRRDQTAFQPSAGVKAEINTAQQDRIDRMCAFICRLCIGQF